MIAIIFSSCCKLIRFTDTGNGYYIEENNDTDVFVPITLYNAEIVANIMFKKLSKTGTAIYRWDGIIPKNVLNFVTNVIVVFKI